MRCKHPGERRVPINKQMLGRLGELGNRQAHNVLCNAAPTDAWHFTPPKLGFAMINNQEAHNIWCSQSAAVLSIPVQLYMTLHWVC